MDRGRAYSIERATYNACSFCTYRGEDVLLVESQVVVGKELLDAVQVTLELAPLQDCPASDSTSPTSGHPISGGVRGQASGFLAQVPLVLSEPLDLKNKLKPQLAYV